MGASFRPVLRELAPNPVVVPFGGAKVRRFNSTVSDALLQVLLHTAPFISTVSRLAELSTTELSLDYPDGQVAAAVLVLLLQQWADLGDTRVSLCGLPEGNSQSFATSAMSLLESINQVLNYAQEMALIATSLGSQNGTELIVLHHQKSLSIVPIPGYTVQGLVFLGKGQPIMVTSEFRHPHSNVIFRDNGMGTLRSESGFSQQLSGESLVIYQRATV